MKTNLYVLPVFFVLFLILQSCSGKEQPVTEQPVTENKVQNTAAEQQLAEIEKAIGALAETLYGPATVQTDTAEILKRLDSLPEQDRNAQTISFQLEVIKKSLDNINGNYSNKTLAAKECKKVLVGYKSCNCAPNPNGTIHCDLCPIYEWVCK